MLSVSATLTDRGERVAPKTETSARCLAIPSWSLAQLRELRASDPSNDEMFVFHTDSGKPMNRHNVRRDLHRVCDHAGLRHVRFHALRSTSLSLRLANGAAYEDVARVAGHKNSRMLVSIYARPMQGAVTWPTSLTRFGRMAPKWPEMGIQRCADHEASKEKARRSGLGRGGGEETRTPDPLHAKQVLYQLSYTPTGRRGF